MNAQFDLFAARQAKREGIRKVTAKNAAYLEIMRGIANMVASRQPTFCADDLRVEADKRGLRGTHYNAIGALFASPQWRQDFKCVGFTVSRQIKGHGNRIMLWAKK